MLDIAHRLKFYQGTSGILLSLKAKAESGKLNIAEQILAESLMDDKETTIQVGIASIDWEKYRRKPKDHQKEAIGFLVGKRRAILADDMGLGKSFSSIAAALETGTDKILIICPKHLVFNLKREVEFFTNDVTIIRDGHNKWKPAKITIMNYEKIGKYLVDIKAHKFGVIIADEGHCLKNHKTVKSKNFGKMIARSQSCVWLLTGTPIANRPIDYFQLLKICKHPLTIENGRWTADDNAWVRFGKQFCNGSFTGFGWDFSGASNVEALHQATKEYVLRRTKETHLDLPDKTVSPIFLGLDNWKDYSTVVEDLFQQKHDASRDIFSDSYGTDPLAAEQLVAFSAIRKFLAYEKIRDGSTLGLIDDALNEEKKVVVFTNYTEVIDLLAKELKGKCTYIDGRTPKAEDRQARVDQFQNDPNCKVIICNYKVGKVGWNLTAGRVSIMNDVEWSPEANMQAQDRIYRIGQEYSVNILYPLYADTMETIFYEILMLKIQIIKHAIDGIPMTDDPARLKGLTQQLFASLDVD